MPQLTIVTRDGAERTVEARIGWSVMENIRDNGVDEVLALCGGCCSCATCHVHVDADWLDKVGPPKADEEDLLDTSDHKTEASRLSCQILYTAELDGLRVMVAPED
jgi:ferredoxin, 2Fe-2S